MGFELKEQCRSRLARLTLPASVLHLALFAAPVLRSGLVIVRGVATQSVKVMLRKLVSRLLRASVIVRTKLPSLASSSVQASTLARQMALLLAIVQPELLSVEWSSVQT
jgi:hypothetical protein